MAEAPEISAFDLESVSDIFEKIFLRFEMKKLIRLKLVCKSWHSFISSPRFVESHLNLSYNNTFKFGHPRIVISASQMSYSRNNNDKFSYVKDACILGSCNGLILLCILDSRVFLVNPVTREVRILLIPQVFYGFWLSRLCWGFGYDSSINDYKVILGTKKDENSTSFQMLNLKKNVWIDIGEINYTFPITSFGVLCNEELYWFMNDQNNERVIISFNISNEKFKEIPKPDNVGYDWGSFSLGHTGESSLCIYHPSRPRYEQWVMKKKCSENIYWEFLPPVCGNYMNTHEEYITHKLAFGALNISLSTISRNISAPIFVPSLVSPYVNGRLKKKWQALMNNIVQWRNQDSK